MSWATENASQIIARTPALVRSMVDGLAPDLIETGSLENWGPRQVIEHLLDVEDIAFRTRISRILDEDNPLIRSIDPPRRLAEGQYSGKALDDLLIEFARRREEDVAWIRTLEPSQLDRVGNHDEAGRITARELIAYWACHDLLHIRQLARQLQAGLEPHIGNTRQFLEET